MEYRKRTANRHEFKDIDGSGLIIAEGIKSILIYTDAKTIFALENQQDVEQLIELLNKLKGRLPNE